MNAAWEMGKNYKASIIRYTRNLLFSNMLEYDIFSNPPSLKVTLTLKITGLLIANFEF